MYHEYFRSVARRTRVVKRGSAIEEELNVKGFIIQNRVPERLLPSPFLHNKGRCQAMKMAYHELDAYLCLKGT